MFASIGQCVEVLLPVLKFLVHAEVSREALLADSWNSWLWQQLPAALVSAVEQLVSSEEAPLYKTWLDLWPTNEIHITGLQNAILSAAGILRDRPVVATAAGLKAPKDCVLAGAAERLIVPAPELAKIGRYYPLHSADRVLERLGSEAFGPDLFRAYVAEQPDALLCRYGEDDGLFDRVVHYLQKHDLQDIACLPVSTLTGPVLEAPSGQLVASTSGQINQLADMQLKVVLAKSSPVTRAWLEGIGLYPATPQAVLEAILSTDGSGSNPIVSAWHLRYLFQVWDQLSAASRERARSEFLSASEEEARLRVEAAIAREDAVAAREALKECPWLVDEDLADRVQLVVEQQALVVAIRNAISDAPDHGGEVLWKMVRTAEKWKLRSSAVTSAVAAARRCIQEMERQARHDAALLHPDVVAVALTDPDAVAAFERRLLVAWEAGMDREHPDFFSFAIQLETGRLRAACGKLELALQNASPGVASAYSALEVQPVDNSKLATSTCSFATDIGFIIKAPI